VYWNGTASAANGLLFTWYVDSQGIAGPLRASSATRIYPWLANEQIGSNMLRTFTMADGVMLVLMTNSSRTTGAAFDSAEAANWTLVSQSEIKDFTANIFYIKNYQIKRNNIIYQALTNHTSVAFFPIGALYTSNWVALSGQMLGGGAPSTIPAGSSQNLSNNTYVGAAGSAGTATPKLVTGQTAQQHWVRIWNNDGGTYTIGLQTATDTLNGVANGTVVMKKKGVYKEFYNPGGTEWFDITPNEQVGLGSALPNPANTNLFRLSNHATLPNGLYYSDGTSWIQG
jgi:hypothetical protein